MAHHKNARSYSLVKFWNLFHFPFAKIPSSLESEWHSSPLGPDVTDMFQPKELIILVVDTVMQKGWKERVNDIKDIFAIFPYPRSFAKALERHIDNDDAVYLTVTATVSAVKEHSGRDDLANEIPEIQRTFRCLVSFKDLFNIASGYQRMVSTPGAMPQDYAVVQAHESQAIYDGQLPPNSKFFTIAPPVQIYHPIFSQFTQIVSDRAIQPTNEDFEQAQSLMKSLSYISTKEHPRNAMIREKLCDILEIDIY
jgi:hypothetical protein